MNSLEMGCPSGTQDRCDPAHAGTAREGRRRIDRVEPQAFGGDATANAVALRGVLEGKNNALAQRAIMRGAAGHVACRLLPATNAIGGATCRKGGML